MRNPSHPVIFLAGTALMAAAVLYGSDLVGAFPADEVVAANTLVLPRLRLAEAEDLLRDTDASQRPATPSASANCSQPDIAGACGAHSAASSRHSARLKH